MLEPGREGSIPIAPKSKKVMDLVFGCKLVGKVKFDDRMLLNFAGEYSRLRCK